MFVPCRMFIQALQWAVAMEYAIKEINERNDLLPNITLTYDIYDSFLQIPIALENSFKFLQENIFLGNKSESLCKPSVMIGPHSSEITTFLSPFLTLFNFPQVRFSICVLMQKTVELFHLFLRAMKF